MSYSELTIGSKLFLKRFTHKSRHMHCVKITKNIKYKKLLDFGSGDGQLFDFFKFSKSKTYHAYEPIKHMHLELKKNIGLKKIKIIKSKSQLPSNYYDIVIVTEVFEHLTKKLLLESFKTLKKISKKKSTIIVSVPIEIGISSLIKNIIRSVIKAKHDNLTFINFIKSFFAIKIDRGRYKYYNSHIGFNYNELIAELKMKKFKIVKQSYTPFNFLKGFLNSQVFLIIKI